MILEHLPDGWRAAFTAFGGPCEVLLDVDGRDDAAVLGEAAGGEAARIERLWSRYRDDNIIHAINHAQGRTVDVDDETAGLLDLAAQCFELGEGRFDVTSGVLRRAWTFDGSANVPTAAEVAALLSLVGWGRVTWRRPQLTLPAGMEVDLGGLGKEYAVDRAAQLLSLRTSAAALVNFGGDLRALGERRDGRPWRVGVEAPAATAGEAPRPALDLELARGALATSGDSRRYLLKDGVRYPHILDPRTGRPVMDAPRSVTVLADSCLEAGVLATLAMLHGRGAGRFLATHCARYWVQA
ncbi:MAG: FAD:protein FMN transferase [bacterium]|nr:FAD:protein FMN transferase [bacterium]